MRIITKLNKELEKFIPIANLIASTFGKNCEVVIHDLTTPQKSVVYTVNSHVTGREIGQTFDHLIKNVLLSKNFKNDYVANYLHEDLSGKKIKSSTALIRDNRDKVVGALCVNYDITLMDDFENWLQEFTYVEIEKTEHGIEPFENVENIVDDLIDKIIGDNNIKEMKRIDKIKLIKFMDEKGIFLMKNSIDKVADKLQVSNVTIYSYLDEVRKNNI